VTSVIVAGPLAQKPNHGGHTWVFLQYLLGFRRLDFDVLFIDRLGSNDRSTRCVQSVMNFFGLPFSLIDRDRAVGLGRQEVLARVRRSALLLNVMGFLDDDEILAAAPKRVFLDIDPGFGQMWRELGLVDIFAGHDSFVTIGENVGSADCEVPTCGLDWVTTRQPVVLDQWPVRRSNGGGCFTSVASWRGAYGPLEYGGNRYGLRVHEFRKFARLPSVTGQKFELALDIHPDESADLELLSTNRWVLADPRTVAADPWSYRSYIQRSLAEFMVAKNMYVETRSGWFSDRSICYLASGKPVLVQDTGLDGRYPVGDGIVTFSTLDEAVAGVEAIAIEYGRHAEAARATAEDLFDSDKVLTQLLNSLRIG
jgi:hypothetical protein